jgi:mannose-1-phosphate guanylyltransferase/mannose-6-phosphate isomerase
LEQLDEIGISPLDVLIEPSPKNTAAAICAAAISLDNRDPGALMLVASSDHAIPNAEHFRSIVLAATSSAQSKKIVTFGIKPDRPETGYGWIELSEQPCTDCSPTPQAIKSFVEKPCESKARELLEGNMHLWNAGIFLFSTTTILEAFETYAPQILATVRKAVSGAQKDLAFTKLDSNSWETCDETSIDYAIMEHADNLTVVPFGGPWSDLGDWQSVWRESQPDVNGNVATGSATSIECSNTLLRATTDSQEIVGIGLDDIVAVAMPDAVLIAHKDRAQDVKQAVVKLRACSPEQDSGFSN